MNHRIARLLEIKNRIDDLEEAIRKDNEEGYLLRAYLRNRIEEQLEELYREYHELEDV